MAVALHVHQHQISIRQRLYQGARPGRKLLSVKKLTQNVHLIVNTLCHRLCVGKFDVVHCKSGELCLCAHLHCLLVPPLVTEDPLARANNRGRRGVTFTTWNPSLNMTQGGNDPTSQVCAIRIANAEAAATAEGHKKAAERQTLGFPIWQCRQCCSLAIACTSLKSMIKVPSPPRPSIAPCSSLLSCK